MLRRKRGDTENWRAHSANQICATYNCLRVNPRDTGKRSEGILKIQTGAKMGLRRESETTELHCLALSAPT